MFYILTFQAFEIILGKGGARIFYQLTKGHRVDDIR